MGKRYVSIWFRHLTTDWFTVRKPELENTPFVLRAPVRGRMVIIAANAIAERKGIYTGMALADARAVLPDIHALDDKPGLAADILKRMADWSIRFTPIVAIDPPDGLLLDATGCSHLWGGDEKYLTDIRLKFELHGYDTQLAMSDTIGSAWALARFGNGQTVIPEGCHIEAILPLPPQALRIEPEVVQRLHKLGLHQIRQFIKLPRTSLRRRFGQHFMMRLNMAIGQELEILEPIHPVEPYQERLPCLDPIVTLTGIEIALKQLLETLCFRLQQEQMGIRTAVLKAYRVDSKLEQVSIGTHRPTHYVKHLFKLFELKISSIEPALGIELFVLEAPKVEEHISQQSVMWEDAGGLEDPRVTELIDRIAGKVGHHTIHRYLPDEHYWPERSYKLATSLDEKPLTEWKNDKLRPLQILKSPERIEVSAPIPDYPPMNFRYMGKLHTIARADGPERIEQEWWLQSGEHRDYYQVEDEEGHRYWLFRLGHYNEKSYQWFIHGFFA